MLLALNHIELTPDQHFPLTLPDADSAGTRSQNHHVRHDHLTNWGRSTRATSVISMWEASCTLPCSPICFYRPTHNGF